MNDESGKFVVNHHSPSILSELWICSQKSKFILNYIAIFVINNLIFTWFFFYEFNGIVILSNEFRLILAEVGLEASLSDSELAKYSYVGCLNTSVSLRIFPHNIQLVPGTKETLKGTDQRRWWPRQRVCCLERLKGFFYYFAMIYYFYLHRICFTSHCLY